MLQDQQPNIISGQDCYHLSVSNVLRFKGYADYLTVWKQCGLSYVKQHTAPLGIMFATYLTRPSELKWIHGVDLVTIYPTTETEFLDGIRSCLDQEEPVIVHVNSVGLTYSKFFEVESHLQSITIVAYENDEFTLISDIEGFKGQVPAHELLRSAGFDSKITADTGLKPNYSTISLANSVSLDRKGIREVIEKNLEMLSGTAEPIDPSNPIHTKMRFAYGIDAIEEFRQSLLQNVEMLEANPRELQKTSTYIYSVSTAHYAFARFLKESSGLVPELEELGEQYDRLGTDWGNISNMIFKGSLAAAAPILNRVSSRLQKIQQTEQDVIDATFRVLESV